MGELGYQEGGNFYFDFLQAASADEYEVLYRKLAARVPDIIIIGNSAGGTSTRRQAHKPMRQAQKPPPPL
jgi:hypothetical protein